MVWISLVLGSNPSIIVVVLENLRVSNLTTIRVSSLSNSPQAHKSSGRPHFLHITAICIYHNYQNPIIKPSLTMSIAACHGPPTVVCLELFCDTIKYNLAFSLNKLTSKLEKSLLEIFKRLTACQTTVFIKRVAKNFIGL